MRVQNLSEFERASLAAAVAMETVAMETAGTGSISMNVNMDARSGGNNYYASLGCGREYGNFDIFRTST